jgi:hypothetical protein
MRLSLILHNLPEEGFCLCLCARASFRALHSLSSVSINYYDLSEISSSRTSSIRSQDIQSRFSFSNTLTHSNTQSACIERSGNWNSRLRRIATPAESAFVHQRGWLSAAAYKHAPHTLAHLLAIGWGLRWSEHSPHTRTHNILGTCTIPFSYFAPFRAAMVGWRTISFKAEPAATIG